MPLLLREINACEPLKKRLFQVEFLTTRDGQGLITLLYHRPVDQLWQQCAAEVAAKLGASIIGRSRKQKVVLTEDYVIETLTVAGRSYQYQQVETGFTQPNADVCECMLNWAQEVSAHLAEFWERMSHPA